MYLVGENGLNRLGGRFWEQGVWFLWREEGVILWFSYGWSRP
jgi:hypothetical protein